MGDGDDTGDGDGTVDGVIMVLEIVVMGMEMGYLGGGDGG